MGETLNNASGALISGMGRDDVGVYQPFPVDSDPMISSDIQKTTNIADSSGQHSKAHKWREKIENKFQ